MKLITFVAITLFSGLLSGIILAVVNLVLVEPYIDQAIAFENQKSATPSEMTEQLEFQTYRVWQQGGSLAAGAVLGMSYGALFGLVFVYTRNSLLGSTNLQKALLLATIMWFVLYLVVELKYPANPPAVSDPSTISLRQSLWLAMVAVSGLTALGLAVTRRWMKGNAKFAALAIYAAIVIIMFLVLPQNPDHSAIPTDLIMGFRIASCVTMTMFWLIMGAILGLLWDSTVPHKITKLKII